MPGKLDANLRSGFLAEDFGALLMRCIGAVAEVSRTEDFGIDAFWTLLHQETARRLVVLDTAYVQLKAVSVKKITAENTGDREWLTGLKLPFYYGVVTRPGRGLEPKLDLYTSHLLHDELAMRKQLRFIGVCFNPQDATYPTHRWHQDYNNAGEDGSNPEGWYPENHLLNFDHERDLGELIREVEIGFLWLGPPILTLTQSSFESDEERQRCFDIIDYWNKLELQNRSLAHLRCVNRARWNENELPHSIWDISQPADRQDYLQTLSPSINAMLMEHVVKKCTDETFEKAVEAYEFVVSLDGATLDVERLRHIRQEILARPTEEEEEPRARER